MALARARDANGLSQREVAAALDVSQRYIVELEAGKPGLLMERLFAFMTLTGIELEARLPRPEDRIGVAPVLWPRDAKAGDAAALHAIDPRRSLEEYEALARDPDRSMLVVPQRIDWPRRRSMRLRAEQGGKVVGGLAGYSLDGDCFVVPGPRADEVRDALRIVARWRG